MRGRRNGYVCPRCDERVRVLYETTEDVLILREGEPDRTERRITPMCQGCSDEFSVDDSVKHDPTGTGEMTAADVQRVIENAQHSIKSALYSLTMQLPKGFVVTGVTAGCVPEGTFNGKYEYKLTADITVQVWPK